VKELYHGSISQFDTININEGKGYKDFGKGFYATAVASHAERLALRNKRIAERRQAFLKAKNIKIEPIVAYRYNLLFSEDIDDLKVMRFKEANTEWFRFIIMNRKCADSAHAYDIVIGPTADAETTAIINDFLDELEQSGYAENVCQKVIEQLKPENLPKQYFFGTERALRTLKFSKVKRQVIS